jgi:hypothetical protein
MIWGCLSFNGIGTLADIKGNINSQIYIDVLENNLWPVIARHFADNEYVFQDDNVPVPFSNPAINMHAVIKNIFYIDHIKNADNLSCRHLRYAN